MIFITNKKFLNHDSPEINRLIMLHVTKKCWRPFPLTKDKLERGMFEIPGERGKAFLKMVGLFWLSYHKKKILCKLKQRNSWTGDKQFSPAIVWQLSTATSAAPLHFFLLSEIGSVSLCNSRYLIYYWFTIRFPCLKSAYKYASLTIKLTLLWKAKQGKTRGSCVNCFSNIARVLALYKSYWAAMNKTFIYARPNKDFLHEDEFSCVSRHFS